MQDDKEYKEISKNVEAQMAKLDKHRDGAKKTQDQIETKESLVKELHKAG